MVDGTNQPDDQDTRLQQYINDNIQYEGIVVTIEDDTTDGMWAEFFADINAKRKEREAWFEEIKTPLNKALAAIRTKEHAACDRLKEIEDIITQARGNWLRVKIAQQKAADALAIEAAKESGGVAVLTQQPTKTVQTSGGASVGLRTQPSWRLTDDNTMTAKYTEREKIEFDRSDPRLKNVPDKAFILKRGMIMVLIKSGDMPEGEHSIEKFDDFASTSK